MAGRHIKSPRNRMLHAMVLQPSLQDQRLEQGHCPNGCGPLDWVNPWHARCIGGCEFTWKPNVAFGGTKATR